MPALSECGFCRTQQSLNAEGTCTACGGPLRAIAGQTSSGERRKTGASSRLLADALDDVGKSSEDVRPGQVALGFPALRPPPTAASADPPVGRTLEFPAVMPIPAAPSPPPPSPKALLASEEPPPDAPAIQRTLEFQKVIPLPKAAAAPEETDTPVIQRTLGFQKVIDRKSVV